MLNWWIMRSYLVRERRFWVSYSRECRDLASASEKVSFGLTPLAVQRNTVLTTVRIFIWLRKLWVNMINSSDSYLSRSDSRLFDEDGKAGWDMDHGRQWLVWELIIDTKSKRTVTGNICWMWDAISRVKVGECSASVQPACVVLTGFYLCCNSWTRHQYCFVSQHIVLFRELLFIVPFEINQ